LASGGEQNTMMWYARIPGPSQEPFIRVKQRASQSKNVQPSRACAGARGHRSIRALRLCRASFVTTKRHLHWRASNPPCLLYHKRASPRLYRALLWVRFCASASPKAGSRLCFKYGGVQAVPCPARCFVLPASTLADEAKNGTENSPLSSVASHTKCDNGKWGALVSPARATLLAALETARTVIALRAGQLQPGPGTLCTAFQRRALHGGRSAAFAVGLCGL
jgi:hypothetical protein